MEVLLGIKSIILVVMAIYFMYQTCISIFCLVKLKDKEPKEFRKNKFVAIIPAHNEETVISSLIKSLKVQEYDKEYYDIYVIADNCTDNTAKIAKDAGAIVYERFDNRNKTKGGALNWFLKKKIDEKADYDAIIYIIIGSIPLFIVNIGILAIDFILYFYRELSLGTLVSNTGNYLLGATILPVLGALLVLILERKPIKPMLKGLMCYPLFLGSWLLINIKCVVKPNTKWEKIEHLRNIEINDVKVKA